MREAEGRGLSRSNRAAFPSLDKKGHSCYYEIVMKQIKQKIELIKYGYTPNEFLPIFSGGKLLNKSEFVSYKLKKIVFERSLV